MPTPPGEDAGSAAPLLGAAGAAGAAGAGAPPPGPLVGRPATGRPGAIPTTAVTRVFLRPVASPFALGFLGLAGATVTLAGQELGWVPAHEHVQVALIVLLTAPLLQLIACVFGFLARDPVAATGMGLLAVSWLVIGAVHLVSHPHSHSPALGTFLLLSCTGMFLSAVTAAESKLLPALVMATTAARFLTTGLFEMLGDPAIKTASGALGCFLGLVALYGAFAVELEGLEHRTVLPTWRRGRGALALQPDLAEQVRTVAAEPGVRNQL